MPTYVYKFVDSGETIEVQQGFTDDTLTEIAHPRTGEVLPVKKVFTPVGVTFKGSGFFKTDNRASSKKAASTSESTGSESSSASSGAESSSTSSSASSGSESSTSSSSKASSDGPSKASSPSTPAASSSS